MRYGAVMPPPTAAPAEPAPAAVRLPPPVTPPGDVGSVRDESRNLLALAAYTVAMRVGVIFKTQSVVMPAFLAAIAGPAWVQGFLPMLNRWGQSVPPLFCADTLRDLPLKTRWVWRTTLGMSAAFAVLAAVLAGVEAWGGRAGMTFRGPWAVGVFLTLYGLFFVATGLNDLGFSTLQAKLVRPHRRGELVAAGGIAGSLVAVAAAVTWLRDWHATGPGDFVAAFAAAAAAMAAAGLVLLAVREPGDAPGTGRGRPRASVAEAWAVLREDAGFRRIAAVAVLFVTAQLIFPHYVPLAARRFGAGTLPLTEYVVAQNLGAGSFSVILGRLADRFGNRLTVRLSLAAAAAVPVAALLAVRTHTPHAFTAVFFLLGMTPVAFRMLTNYTLELTDPARHPRYVSTLKLCLAAPFLFAVPVGGVLGLAGATPVFLAVATLVACGCGLTWFIGEPRTGGGTAARG